MIDADPSLSVRSLDDLALYLLSSRTPRSLKFSTTQKRGDGVSTRLQHRHRPRPRRPLILQSDVSVPLSSIVLMRPHDLPVANIAQGIDWCGLISFPPVRGDMNKVRNTSLHSGEENVGRWRKKKPLTLFLILTKHTFLIIELHDAVTRIIENH